MPVVGGETRLGPTLALADAARRRWDAVVVGAGPAGALAARQLARAGAGTLLVDRTRVSPRQGLRVLPERGGAGRVGGGGAGRFAAPAGRSADPPFCLACGRATGGDCTAERDVGLARGAGCGVGRSGRGCGGVVCARVRGHAGGPLDRGLHDSHGRRGSAGAGARAVCLAADGLGGRFLHRLPEHDPIVTRGSRFGAGTVVDAASATVDEGTITMACGPAGYAGLVRLEDGRLNIAAALDLPSARRAGGVGPAVIGLLRGNGIPIPDELASARWRGTAALLRRVRRVEGHRLLVLGDAAGYVEPFTGEGMAWAMVSSILIAPLALEGISGYRGEIGARWRAVHRRWIGRRQRLCRLSKWLLRLPLACRSVVAVLGQAPWLARPVTGALNRAGWSRMDGQGRG